MCPWTIAIAVAAFLTGGTLGAVWMALCAMGSD